jgi:hypothetical protein
MPDTLPRRVTMMPQLLLREPDGEAVILDLNSERSYGLDEAGTRIWQPPAEYEVDSETLTRHMAELIANLAQNGVVGTEPL